MNTDRFKNPYMFFGIIATIFATVGIEPIMLQEWEILKFEVLEVLNNPYKIGCLVVALVGVYIDPTTKGLKDSDDKIGGKRFE